MPNTPGSFSSSTFCQPSKSTGNGLKTDMKGSSSVINTLINSAKVVRNSNVSVSKNTSESSRKSFKQSLLVISTTAKRLTRALSRKIQDRYPRNGINAPPSATILNEQNFSSQNILPMKSSLKPSLNISSKSYSAASPESMNEVVIIRPSPSIEFRADYDLPNISSCRSDTTQRFLGQKQKSNSITSGTKKDVKNSLITNENIKQNLFSNSSKTTIFSSFKGNSLESTFTNTETFISLEKANNKNNNTNSLLTTETNNVQKNEPGSVESDIVKEKEKTSPRSFFKRYNSLKNSNNLSVASRIECLSRSLSSLYNKNSSRNGSTVSRKMSFKVNSDSSREADNTNPTSERSSTSNASQSFQSTNRFSFVSSNRDNENLFHSSTRATLLNNQQINSAALQPISPLNEPSLNENDQVNNEVDFQNYHPESAETVKLEQNLQSNAGSFSTKMTSLPPAKTSGIIKCNSKGMLSLTKEDDYFESFDEKNPLESIELGVNCIQNKPKNEDITNKIAFYPGPINNASDPYLLDFLCKSASDKAICEPKYMTKSRSFDKSKESFISPTSQALLPKNFESVDTKQEGKSKKY